MEVLNQWKQGILFPRWAALAHWGYGEARFIFYPPISWNLGAILGTILPWKIAPGVYVWLALAASGFSMFALARRWFSQADAMVAAIFYAANPYHIVVVYWRSAFAELLASCLLPLLLLLVLRSAEEGARVVLPLSLLVAAALLTNVPAAVMVNYSLALLILVVTFACRAPRVLLYGTIAVVLGAALAGFYLAPAAYEQKWVDIAQVLAPGVRPQDNFLFTTISDVDHNKFNLIVSMVGTSEVVVLTAAIFLSRRWRSEHRAQWWSLCLWGVACSLIMCSFTLPLWRWFPKLQYVQLPWRWLLCLNVPLAVLFAAGFRRWISRIVVYALLLAVIAAVWQRIQEPWWDTAADIEEMHDAIQDATGYEGTDEYVPIGADPYNLDKNAPLVTADAAAIIRITSWTAESKIFSAEMSHPGKLRLRLFNYPAWQVRVNQKLVPAETAPNTGEILIPVAAGHSDISVSFSRTRDRSLGTGLSLIAMLGILIWIILRLMLRMGLRKRMMARPIGST
jgi:6-pyruvoyl-tetrahydropterin synthase related domain